RTVQGVSRRQSEDFMYRTFARLASISLLVVMVGCNNMDAGDGTGGGGDQPDMTEPPPPDMSLPKRDPTDHPALTQMDYYGRQTLAAPEVWTVVWQGDEALGAKTNDFINWMLNSGNDFWTPGVSEYKVGAGKGMGVIVLPDAAPATIDDTMLTAMVKTHI